MNFKKVVATLLSIACIATQASGMTVKTQAYEGQPLGINVAHNRVVRLSNNTNNTDFNRPEYLTDGNVQRGYQATCEKPNEENDYDDPQQWNLDLGKSYTIDTVSLYWEAAAAKVYDVLVSETGKDGDWKTVVTETEGAGGKLTYEFTPVDARYIKFDLKERVFPNYGYCCYEIQVFTVGSVEEKDTDNLAATANVTSSEDDGEHPATNATDGNMDTMWRTTYFTDSSHTPAQKAAQNLTMEWATPQSFDVIRISWAGGYMKGYKFQISEDGENWDDIYEVTAGRANEVRKIKLDAPVSSKYLRLQGVTFGEYCFEVKEIAVFNETNVPVEKINLNYKNLKLDLDDKNNNRMELEYNLNPSNTSQKDVVWSSSNTNVATVENGVVKAVGQGRCVVTLASKDNGAVKATCNVNVAKELDKSVISVSRNNKNVNINWTKVNGASSYIVTRQSASRSVEAIVYQGTNLSCVDQNVISGRYVYYVIAVVDESLADADIKSNSISEYSDLVLIPEDVVGVRVDNFAKHIGLFVGGDDQVLVSVLPTNATNQDVSFKSSNTNIVTVDQYGIVRAIAPGDAEITVTTAEGGFTDKCTVHVDEVAVTGFDRITEKSFVMEKEQMKQLEYKILPENATYKELTWNSNNTSVATVDANGIVKAIGPGYATITGTNKEGASIDFYVEVKKSITSISFGVETKTIYVGKTEKINAVISPSDASDKTLNWVSSNSTIASVDSNGNVKAISEGTTYISATSADGKIEAVLTVNVTLEPITKPAKVKLYKVKKSKGFANIKWKKIADAKGYVVYMKKGSGKFKAIGTFKSNKTVKLKKKLKAGKYQFKVRAYKLDDGMKLFGKYSRVQKIKI